MKWKNKEWLQDKPKVSDDEDEFPEKTAHAKYLKEKRDRLLGFVNDQSPTKSKKPSREAPEVFECKVCEVSTFNPCFRTDSAEKLVEHMEKIHYQLTRKKDN